MYSYYIVTSKAPPPPPAFAATPPAGRDPSAVLEQLCWVVSMAGHVLADAGEGETPLVPLPILEACAPPAWAAPEGPAGGPAAAAWGAVGGDQDAVMALSQCLLGVGAMCMEEAGRPVISPRCDGLKSFTCTVLGTHT